MNVVIYTRVSSQEQVSGYSLDAQENACRQWAAEQGYEITRVYVEPGQSARTDQRPAFQKMIQMVKLGIADAILIHKSDRIARNLLDLLSYRSQLEQAGKRILSATEPFLNDDSPENRMVTGIIGSVNEFYSANLSREVIKGQLQKAKSGSFPGGKLPLGYRRNDDKQIVIDDTSAEVAHHAFQEFAQGHHTLKTWTAAARERGYRNPRGNPISDQSWQKIFRNPFYIGQFRWGDDLYDGDHPPLTTKETFVEVQVLLDEHGGGGGAKNRHFWLLAGLLWSAKYHKKMTGSLAKGKYPYYRAAGPGPEHTVRAEDIESRVVALLDKITGYSPRARESWRLAMQVAPSTAVIWPLLPANEERKDFLNLIFPAVGIIIAPGGAVSRFDLREGFETA